MTSRLPPSRRGIQLPTGLRDALASLPDILAQENLKPPPLRQVYVPGSHYKALSLDSTLVVGMRGAGKSVWTAVLLTDVHRKFVASLTRNEALGRAEVRLGFGLDESGQYFPNATEIAAMLRDMTDPIAIWKTIVIRHAVESLGGSNQLPGGSWKERCAWVTRNPELAEQLLADCDTKLDDNGRVLLVLFDAMDRLATDWASVRGLIMGALRFALSCRARKAIRLKFFLRPDMEEDSEIWRFPDSSKLRHSKVELTWRPTELYCLILTHLANHDACGEAFRNAVSRMVDVRWIEQEGVFPVPQDLANNEAKLRPIIEAIAGEWMGRDKKRGFAYTWVPLHLADALGRVSPRSFLLAFKHAALLTAEAQASAPTPLHYMGIQGGVAQASSIRIQEIKEEYPWVEPLLEAARNLFVPCEATDFRSRWTTAALGLVRSSSEKLPPRRFTTDPVREGQPDALIDDLIELAVLYRTEDGRLNMPDIFRVGFGIKRKGGVKPLRS